MISERQQAVLRAAVREHLHTALPVASQELTEHFPTRISSATIRNEMQELDDGGYLEQPYTSAGRIPTDKGYRYFVDHLLVDFSLRAREQKIIHEMFAAIANTETFVKTLSSGAARMTKNFAAAGIFEESTHHEQGFAEIFAEPELRNSDILAQFGRLVDLLDDAVRDLWEEEGADHERVFIGRENPLREARNYSMIITRWKHPAGFHGFLTLIGPKRMDYQKNVALARFIEESEF